MKKNKNKYKYYYELKNNQTTILYMVKSGFKTYMKKKTYNIEIYKELNKIFIIKNNNNNKI